MANEHSGALISYGFAIEGTRGTVETAPDCWYPRLSGSIEDKVEVDKIEVAQGVITDDETSRVTKTWSEGDFEGLIADTNFGFILNALFGDAPAPSNVETTAYDHTFEVLNNNTHQTLTIFKKDPINTYKFPYFMLDTFSVEFVKDQIFRFTMNGRGKKKTTDSDTVSLTAQNYFKPSHFELKLATSQSGLGAASEVVVSRAKIDIAKGVSDDMIEWNDGEPYFIGNGQMKVTGEIELLYTGVTEHDYVMNGTEKAIRIGAYNTDVTIGATSNPEVEFDIYKARFEDLGIDESFGGLKRQTLTFTAYYDLSNSKTITCRLRNERSTAYDA